MHTTSEKKRQAITIKDRTRFDIFYTPVVPGSRLYVKQKQFILYNTKDNYV